ncbi:hypothetical protein BC567DRAFT_235645 [Phyllosticta citribraziliensis]
MLPSFQTLIIHATLQACVPAYVPKHNTKETTMLVDSFLRDRELRPWWRRADGKAKESEAED